MGAPGRSKGRVSASMLPPLLRNPRKSRSWRDLGIMGGLLLKTAWVEWPEGGQVDAPAVRKLPWAIAKPARKPEPARFAHRRHLGPLGDDLEGPGIGDGELLKDTQLHRSARLGA